MIDRVRGFDRVADVLLSAAAIAILREPFNPSIAIAILKSLLDLQNVPDSTFDELSAYAPTKPGMLLDAIEFFWGDHAPVQRRTWLIWLLHSARSLQSVASEIYARFPRWMSFWAPTPYPFVAIRPVSDEERDVNEKNQKELSDRLSGLTEHEKRMVSRYCHEDPRHDLQSLDQAAILLVAGLPLRPLSDGLAGWAVAESVQSSIHRGYRESSWLLRLNPIDQSEVEASLEMTAREFAAGESTEVAQASALRLLYKIGSERAFSIASEIDPEVSPGVHWRRVETFCDTDPLDPASSFPTNLENAIGALDALQPNQISQVSNPPTSRTHWNR